MIAVPKLGSLWISDILLIIVFFASFYWKEKNKDIFEIKSIIILLAYFILLAIYNFITGFPIQNILNGFRGVAYFFYIVPVINIVRTSQELKIFFQISLFYILLSSLMIILGFFHIIKLEGIYSATLTDIFGYGNVVRYYPAAEYFIDFFVYVLFAVFLLKVAKVDKIYYSISLITIIFGVIITFTRSTYILTLLAFIVISFSIKKSMKGAAINLISLIVIFYFFTFFSSTDVYGGIIRLVLGGQETIRGQGNIVARAEILAIKFNTILNDSPIIGRGFDWGLYSRFQNIDFNPIGRSNHNGYASLFVIGGFLGIFLFIYNLIRVHLKGIELFKIIKDDFMKALLIGALVYNILVNIKAMVTDPYTDATGSIVFGFIWGIIIVIAKLNYRQKTCNNLSIRLS